MIRLSNLKLPLDYDDETVEKRLCRELGIDKECVEKFCLYKRSIDARKKNDIHFTATVDIILNCDESRVLSRARCKNALRTTPYEYNVPRCKALKNRPLVVGFGPGGMFSGLTLAYSGARPLIIEQGKDCDSRVKDVENFIKTGVLNPSSNIQFGEGGAGTFSDGKLNTGTKDTRARFVLNEFVKHGAPREILYNFRPHMGTDNLRKVVKSIRKTIIDRGGDVIFEAKLTALIIEDGAIKGAKIIRNGKEEIFETDNIILAIGHSSRETYKMLYGQKVALEQKPFSIGARIEHLRESIDKSQYGTYAGNKRLGAAYYNLSAHLKNGRGAYTFCMCPGGEVVAAASEENMLCTNGMSEFARDKINSNSALLVSVTPKDFKSDNPLAGIELQRSIEKSAYRCGAGDYRAPVQRVEDFLNKRKTTVLGEVKPSYRRGYTFCETDNYLPEYITQSMREGLLLMDSRLKGFAHPDAVLTGAETRSSSPVRIIRDESLQSINVKGLYPCGEGAGYAGGIVSAAVDGIKCAEKVLI